MSILGKIEEDLTNKVKDAKIPLEKVHLLTSNRKDLGDYQLNDAFVLAKVMHKNPKEIAESLKKVFDESGYFQDVTIAGAGFLNVTLKDEVLISSLNTYYQDEKKDVDLLPKGKIIIDYGGANVGKTLHVGHLRPADIGEALKRLSIALGKEVIGDVHFGDIGRQSGMILYELKRRYPNLNYFSGKKEETWDEVPITAEDLEEIYPLANSKAKEDEAIMEEVRELTKKVEEKEPGLYELWEKVKEISIEDIKKIYKKLNTTFDLWEGESDCYPYMEPMIERLKREGYLTLSEGAMVIDVKKETDKAPMPSLVVVKQNGATLYATRELATLVSRIERFSPDEIWYVVDNRQELYFEQVFRASYKTKIVKEDTKLSFLGFGTMNDTDGKPFKTRDGSVATLKGLLKDVKEEVKIRMKQDFKEEEKEEIAEKVSIAAIKYADLLPNRTTDFIFDVEKFVDVEGKTGPYLLYSSIRMKSILNKAKEQNIVYQTYHMISSREEKEMILLLLKKNEILQKAYETKDLSGISDYLYQLTSLFSRFYEKNYILSETDKKRQESWLILTKSVYDTNRYLFDILGIEVPEKM